MNPTATDPVTGSVTRSREELHRVAVHILARARIESTGRFSLRVAPGGFSIPDIDDRRVRVVGGHLVVESDEPGAAVITARAIAGSTLRELARFAGVDLAASLDVGHDTPPLGAVDDPIEIDPAAAAGIGRWYEFAAGVLDQVAVAVATEGRAVTLVRLWPEHFDVAIETDARPGLRVNLGASPGDGFHDRPYWYVGPWTDDRPGDPGFWSAPFGAYRPTGMPGGDEAESGRRFLLDGLARLRKGGFGAESGAESEL